MILFAFIFILATVIWFSGYFTGRDDEQKLNHADETSLGRQVLKTKDL